MKKLLFASLAAILAFSSIATAQNGNKDILDEIEGLEVPDKKASGKDKSFHESNWFAYLGYGFGNVTSETFDSNLFDNAELFINVFQLGVNPSRNFGITIGADLRFDDFSSRDYVFSLDADKNVIVFPGTANASKKNISMIRRWGLGCPALFRISSGKFAFGAGAELQYTFSGRTISHFKEGNVLTDVRYKKAKINQFTYNIKAECTYNDIGVYFKYYPSAEILPSPAPSFDLWSIGITINIDD